MDEAYRALIASDRVSSQTRDVLMRRTGPVDALSAGSPAVLTRAQRETLLAVIGRIIPSSAMESEGLAARLEALLAAGTGDGWRFARLPGDREAMALALETLDQLASAASASAFVTMAAYAQKALLQRVQNGSAQGAPFSAEQMRLWFEDLRAAVAQLYVSHPETMALIGYSGIANGGDGPILRGFTRIGLAEREDWEPEPRSGLLR